MNLILKNVHNLHILYIKNTPYRGYPLNEKNLEKPEKTIIRRVSNPTQRGPTINLKVSPRKQHE